MLQWRRNTYTSFNLSHGFNWEDAIGPGSTYLRVHLRWGFHIDCPTGTDIQGLANSIVTLGLATTVGNGSEQRPDARSGSADQAPPTQRWIYWETRSPVVTAVDAGAGVMTLRDSGPTEPTQTKGQVKANNIPAGDSLNLSSCWACPATFDAYTNVVLWISMSILRDVV